MLRLNSGEPESNAGGSLFDQLPAADGGATGERLRDAALDLLELHRPRLIRAGRRALLLHLLEHGTGSMDDVRVVVPVPAGIDPRAFGVVPRQLVALKIIAAVGYERTRRADNHARPICTWRLLDRDKALTWLAANPEPTERTGGAG